MSREDTEPYTSRARDLYDDPRSPVFDLLTPRPEEAAFNEFTPRLPPEEDGDGYQDGDGYEELPAQRSSGEYEYDPYARAAGDRKVLLKGQPSFGLLMSSLPERQDDFITIDWGQCAEKDRQRRRKLEQRIQALPWYQQGFVRAWDGAQAWIALLVIGFLTGAVAALIGIGTEWFTDLRFGLCRGRGFWITRDICCKDMHASDDCKHWQSWSLLLPPLLGWGGVEVLWTDGHRAWVDLCSYVAISVTLAVFAAWLCVAISTYAAGSGISEIKVVLGGFVIKRLLGAWTLLAKSIGLMLAVGSGLMVGKEGPCVHLACCTANLVARFFPKFRDNEMRKRELISSAAAAGVAVAFGAPVGGVLFSLEEVSSYFPAQTMWRSIFCAIIAAFTINRLDPLPFHRYVLFEVHFHHQWQLLELIPFAFIGVVGGIIGAAFVRVNTHLVAKRKKSAIKHWPMTEVALVALLTSLIDYPAVYLRGSNISLLHSLFGDCKDHGFSGIHSMCQLEHADSVILSLVLCAVIKFALTLFTFGLKVPGGIFVPSLTIGALLGRAVGFGIKALHYYYGDNYVFEACKHTSTCINPAIYAIVGAAAVLAGVTRMTVSLLPSLFLYLCHLYVRLSSVCLSVYACIHVHECMQVSLVVIMIEVTNGLQYVLPVMVGIICSKLVADAMGDDSIYIEHIRLHGLPLLDEKAEYNLYGETARDVMHGGQMCVLTLTDETLQSLQTVLDDTPFHGFPVVCAVLHACTHARARTHSAHSLMHTCR